MAKRNNTVVQCDFTGGMVDSACFGKTVSDNTYRYAENLDFQGGQLTFRPDSELLYNRSYVTRGAFLHTSGRGSFLVSFHNTASGNNILNANVYKLTADVVFTVTGLLFPALYGHSAGGLYGDESNPISDPVVYLQVGDAGYVWVRRGTEVLAFRWDGIYTGPCYLVQLATEFGSVGEVVPAAGAACFAYGRVFCAVRGASVSFFNALAISTLVIDTANPVLSFDSTLLTVDGNPTGDILAICSAGAGRLFVFSRSSTWVVRGCDGEPSGMRIELVDPNHGCIGPRAAVQVEDDVWYVSDDGVRSAGKAASHSGGCIPMTAPIADFWSERVVALSSMSACASAVVYGSRVLFSVPVDGTYMSAALVYSLTHKCWVGLWTDFAFQGFLNACVHGSDGLKVVDSTASIWKFGKVEAVLGNYEARFLSRAFPESFFNRTFQFVKASVFLFTRQLTADGSTSVPIVADFGSVDVESEIAVTHLTDESMWGSIHKMFALGRVCRALSLDIFFKSGLAVLQSVSVGLIKRGRL